MQLQQMSGCQLCSSVQTGLLSYTIKLEGGMVVKRHLDQIRKTLQSERRERGEPEDLQVEPIHPPDKPCSRAMVPVLLGEPKEWDVAPDLSEQQQNRLDKQIEQDKMVPLLEISTGPENLETHVEPTRASNLGANKGVTPVRHSSRRGKARGQTEFFDRLDYSVVLHTSYLLISVTYSTGNK